MQQSVNQSKENTVKNLRGLDQGRGAVQSGWNHFVAGDVLYIGFDARCDIDLVAVKGDALETREEVLLGDGLDALLGDLAGQLVEFGAGFGNFLGGIDEVHRVLQRALAACVVRHLHHDHAHVLGQHDNLQKQMTPKNTLAMV